MGGVAWTNEEDNLLRTCIERYGEGKWHRIPVLSGLNRCRKSCRLRWLNYLRPNIKRGSFAQDEVDLIIKLQRDIGNRWSFIAGKLPGRTANDVKNYWKCHLSKRLDGADNQEDRTEHKASTRRNVKLFRPRLQNLATGSKRQRTRKGLFPPTNTTTLPTPSLPAPQEERSISSTTLVSSTKQAEAEDGGRVTPEGDHQENEYLEIGEHDLVVGDLSMDFRFEEINNSSCCSKWDSDDLILGMDLWSHCF